MNTRKKPALPAFFLYKFRNLCYNYSMYIAVDFLISSSTDCSLAE